MNTQDLVARLAPVRVPAEFARFGVQDALAMIALGIVAGLVVAWALRHMTRRVRDPVAAAQDEIAAFAEADRETRLTGIAAVLRRAGRPVPEELSAALYDPDAAVDLAAVDRAARAAIARGPGA